MNPRPTPPRVLAVVAGATLSATALAGLDAIDLHAGVEVVEVNAHSIYLQAATVDTTAPRDAAVGTLADLIRAQQAPGAPGLAGRHFVLQLSGPMRPEWRTRLEQAGISIGDYLPINAFIASLAKADPDAVAALDFVRWFDEYRSEWKLAPDLGLRTVQTQERRDIDAAGQALVIITLFRDATVDEVVAHLGAAANGQAQVHWAQDVAGNPTVAVTMPKADLPALASLASVQFVENAPEITLRNDTDRWIVQSNIPNSTPLYTQGLHGEGQVLGLLDTRLDRNHCSFSDSQPIGPLHRKIIAYNGSAGAEFHGTHVAGTAVGDAGNSTATRGIAYAGKVVYNTIPAFNETDMQARLNTHHGQGARLHTNSWGDDGTTQYNSLCRGIDAFSYNNEEDLILFAVTNLGSLKNPENAKNLLAVGASQDNPSQGNHCSGGNGPTSDQRRKPEIYAPGCSTNSADAGTSCNLTTATGTSMACPAVAATGMLVRQYFMDGFYPSGSASPSDSLTPSGALIKSVLLNSAADMTGVTGYPSNREGWGRVLADDALFFQGDARRLFVADVRNAQGLQTNGIVEYPLTVLTAGQPLKITLVWTEPAATAGASFASINDLDLEVVAPSGDVYKGNVFTGGQSSLGGTRDDRNNVEQVHLTTPAAGMYSLRIRGAGVNQGLQGFAIAATGDIFVPAAGISIDFLTPLQTTIAPGASLPLTIRVNTGADTIVPGSPTLHYRFDTGDFTAVPMSAGELPVTYLASLPAPVCGDAPQFYFSAAGVETGTRTAPPAGEAAPYVIAVGDAVVAFADAMESEVGWTAGVPGDTATRGAWFRGNPNPGPGVPPGDHSEPGIACFFTGQESTFGGGSGNDVDAGFTTLLSPRFDLSQDTSAVISYWRWYSNNAGAAPGADVFRVEVSADDGLTWALLEEIGPDGDEAVGGWMYHQSPLQSVIALTSQVRVRFIARDAGTDSNIEAAIDDFRIDAVECVGSPACPCDWDESGVLNSQDFFAFVTDFFNVAGDFDGNGTTNSQDFFEFVTCFFAGCP